MFHCLYNPCRLTRWAQSQAHSGFCPLGAGHFHSPVPSRLRQHPSGPSCRHRLSPRVHRATLLIGRHTCWAHQPDGARKGLGVEDPQVRKWGTALPASPPPLPFSFCHSPGTPDVCEEAGSVDDSGDFSGISAGGSREAWEICFVDTSEVVSWGS
jgi:hypothetical protein